MSFATITVVLFSVVPASLDDTPNATAIQKAMNQGVELEFHQFQELADVKILQGGITSRGDFLFVCDAKLIWKVDPEVVLAYFKKLIEHEVSKQPAMAGEILKAFIPMVFDQLKTHFSFEKGGTVTKVRFRVRLEKGGNDFIATTSKISEFGINPMRISKDVNIGQKKSR